MIASAADEFPDQRFRGHQSGVDALQRLQICNSHSHASPTLEVNGAHRLELAVRQREGAKAAQLCE